MENEYMEEIETIDTNEISGDGIGGENDVSSNSDILPDNGFEQLPSNNSESNTEQSLEELLRQYFSGATDSKSVDPEKDVLEEKSLEEGLTENANSESSEIDYTQILDDLYDMAAANNSIQEETLQSIQEYEDNNTLQSDVNNISLGNALLLYVASCILFVGLLTFARRIF